MAPPAFLSQAGQDYPNLASTELQMKSVIGFACHSRYGAASGTPAAQSLKKSTSHAASHSMAVVAAALATVGPALKRAVKVTAARSVQHAAAVAGGGGRLGVTRDGGGGGEDGGTAAVA